ncbi:MAG: class I SAM-dependent methyltransferase [Candidatus Heimdallarchaeota archaeon]
MKLVSHFDKIAPKYRQLRQVDLPPIAYLSQLLDNTTTQQGLELGCGTGRYSQLLLNYLPNLFLICCDYSNGMLDELKRKLQTRGKLRFDVLEKKAEELAFHKNTFDILFSFNAIHHLDMNKIIPHAEEWISSGGWIFLYTRFPSQNRSSVWGRNFPKFVERESRLYTEDQLKVFSHNSCPPRTLRKH